jgi:ribosomal protein L32
MSDDGRHGTKPPPQGTVVMNAVIRPADSHDEPISSTVAMPIVPEPGAPPPPTPSPGAPREHTKESALAMTECVRCKTVTPLANFCSECGAPILARRFCSECGAHLGPGAKFCAGCGKKTTA